MPINYHERGHEIMHIIIIWFVNSKAFTKYKNPTLCLCLCSPVWDIYFFIAYLPLSFLFSCHYFNSSLDAFSVWSLKSKVHTKVYNGPWALITPLLLFLFAHFAQILKAFLLSLHLPVAASFNFIQVSAHLLPL